MITDAQDGDRHDAWLTLIWQLKDAMLRETTSEASQQNRTVKATEAKHLNLGSTHRWWSEYEYA